MAGEKRVCAPTCSRVCRTRHASSILAVRSDDRRRHISLTSNLCLCLPVGNQLAAMGHQRYDPQLVLITLTHTLSGV